MIGRITNDVVRFTLIIPKDLNKWLNQQAALFNHSKNKHIIFLLQNMQHTSAENVKRLSTVQVVETIYVDPVPETEE